VAGSYLASQASRLGMDVVLFEARERYFKPCGEVVPTSLSNIIPGRLVRTSIRRYRFYVDGELAEELSYSESKWLIIDKAEMVHGFLAEAEERGARILFRALRPGGEEEFLEGGVVVDARGPYSPIPRRTIMLARMILEEAEVDGETVELWFDSRRVGFYWVFPHGRGEANIGAGFIGEDHPHMLLEEFKASHPLLSEARVRDLRAAPLTIMGGSPYYKGMLAVGEAAGLVYPLTGEGIRPAILSAQALLHALRRAGGRGSREYAAQLYRDSVGRMVSDIRVQRTLLARFRSLSSSGRRRLLKMLPRELWEKIYVEGSLSLGDVVRTAVRKPGLLLALI